MITFIPSDNLDKMRAFVEKANRRAKKLGLTGFDFKCTGNLEMRKFGPKEAEYEIAFAEISIEGETPKFAGWKLIARIELDPVIGSLAKVVPGEELPAKYLNHDNVCDHCKTKRERNNNYVLQNVDTGEYKSVGSSCIKLFLGGRDAEALVWMMSFISSLEDVARDPSWGGLGHCARHYDIELVLAKTNVAIRKHGWCSTATANTYENMWSTRGRVTHDMFGMKVHPDDRLPTTDEDYAKAKEVIEYFKNYPEEKINSDYISNIVKFAKAGVCNDRGFGIVCSMINAFNKNMEFEASRKKAKEEKDAKLNEWYGEPGDKVEVKLVFKNSYVWNSFYGTTVFNVFEDDKGRAFTWATSTSNSDDLEVDKEYTLKGTIKAHNEFKGTKQTQLLRCKIV